MKLDLPEVLTLVGRLDDAPGVDTPRDRFRRFLTEQVMSVAAVRSLLDQTHVSLTEQHARARQDLVLLLGRFLGFEVAFGSYEAVAGAVRLEGHWRSRRRARIAIEVRSEQTGEADPDTLMRTLAALSASLPADTGEKWVGLCVTTPFYAAVRRLQTQLSQRGLRDIRCVSLDSLLWLAEMSEAGRVEHGDVLRLLSSGPDSDFMVSLMRRLTESSAGGSRAAHEDSRHDPDPASEAPPRLAIVTRTEPDPVEWHAEFWLVTLLEDEAATPEQLLDAVIARRQVLGLARAGTPLMAAQGDWVCFHIGHLGIVGHARLDTVISDASAVIRGAARFSAVFRLKDVSIYDVPRVVIRQTMELDLWRDVPADAAGAFISPLSRDEYERLTIRQSGSFAANS
jgi:hypothetical protein